MPILIASKVTGPVVLRNPLLDNLVLITATGGVSSTGTGVDGIDGTAAAPWIIINSGTISSTTGHGISLAGAGNITNGLLTDADASISGSIAGIGIYGAGVVGNWGHISGRYGVAFGAGGTVANYASGTISSSKFGVLIQNGSGTVVNAGSITSAPSAAGVSAYGVALIDGGQVTNSGYIMGGADGIIMKGQPGTINNFGRIAGPGDSGILLSDGGSITNNASASISGYNEGIYVSVGSGKVTNSGSIRGEGINGSGVYLKGGGSITNNAGGSIYGRQFGVFTESVPSTIVNAGKISASDYDGLVLGHGGSVTNAAGASIVGSSGGIYAKYRASATITNAGSISGTATGSAGVFLDDGGAITNAASASISGASFGVYIAGASGTLTNSGNISGTTYDGVILGDGGSVTNAKGGSITSGNNGVYLQHGGTVTNAVGGSVSGAAFGVFVIGGSGTVVNAGHISGTNNFGIDLSAGGTVSNAAGALISSGGIGVAVYGTGGTVTNGGTITGSSYAVAFSNSGNNRLVVNPGAVFNGRVLAGSSGSNTLELTSGASAGSIGGIGGSIYGFGTVAVDTGATWTLAGSNTAGTVLNNGALAVASNGSLNVTTAIDPLSTGVFDLNNNSVLTIATDTGTADKMAFLGSAEAIIDTASLFGTNVGLSNYAGPLIEDFKAGDSFDLANIAAAGVTLDYTSSTGLLQVVSGGADVASLLFQNFSLGSGTFHSASDGGSGLLITHS